MFIKMFSYLVLTLALILLTLSASQQASAAAVGDQEKCIANAYQIYDILTKYGCSADTGADECRKKFDYAIKTLNDDLDKCGRSDYVTLCRIQGSGGFFSFSGCSSLSGGGKLTKAECEAQGSKDFTFNGADGSKTLFEAKNSRCIDTIDYDCHNLCK